MRQTAELVGFALLLAFFYVVWWPATLLAGGVLLLIWANLVPRPRPDPGSGDRP